MRVARSLPLKISCSACERGRSWDARNPSPPASLLPPSEKSGRGGWVEGFPCICTGCACATLVSESSRDWQYEGAQDMRLPSAMHRRICFCKADRHDAWPPHCAKKRGHKTHQSWAPCGKKKREGSARPSLSTAYAYIVQDRVRARSLWLTEALRERSSKSRFLGSLNLEQPAQNSHDEAQVARWVTINERLHPRTVRQRAHARTGNTNCSNMKRSGSRKHTATTAGKGAGDEDGEFGLAIKDCCDQGQQ